MKLSLGNFALFKRSLLLDNRSWQGYIYRLTMLSVILFTLLQFSVTSLSRLLNASGLYFLTSIGEINLVFISLISVSVFTSAITEEKEVDSLGLLLMTGTTPLAILLSKGTGKLIMGLMLILSQFPFVLLSVTLGGVSIYQVASVFITLITYIILLNNFALLLSVIFKRTATASGIMLATVATLNILLPIWDTTRWLSPFYRITVILRTFSNEPLWNMQANVYIVMSILFFLLSYMLFDTCCTKHTQAATPVRMPTGIRHAKWNLCRVKRAWKNAISWKAFYFDTGGKYTMLLVQIILLIILLIVVLIFQHLDTVSAIDLNKLGAMIIPLGVVALFVEGIYICDSLFHAEVWGNTLSTLMTTPHSIEALISRKLAGGVVITIPTILFTAVGLLCSKHDIMDALTNSDFWLVMILFALSIIFYYQLVVLFSILIKYGGFVIAFFTHALIYIIISIPVGIIITLGRTYIPANLIAYLAIVLYIPLIIAMYILIINRIEKAATA